jgi:hypothetical protein
MVSFHSGKPSGITGSELSSCKREMAFKRTNQLKLYRNLRRRKDVRPEIGCLKDEDPLSTCIATCDLVLGEWPVGTLLAFLLISLAFLHQPGSLELLLPLASPQPAIPICARNYFQHLKINADLHIKPVPPTMRKHNDNSLHFIHPFFFHLHII